jgi:branched-chain amino acid transport system permease protein
MDGFLLQVFSGLANGSIYALVALALVMIYQSTHHINLAQGEMAMFATFIAWALIQAGVPYWVAFFATIAIAFVGGLLVQRIFIKPVERAPVLNNVIVFVGLLVIFNALAGWIFDHTVKAFESPFPVQSPVLNQYISGHQLGTLGVTLGVLLSVYAFFRFTPIGLAMRAAAQNPDSAALVGIRVSSSPWTTVTRRLKPWSKPANWSSKRKS